METLRTNLCFPFKMTSGNVGGNKQEVSIFAGARRLLVDQIKEDGIRKELYVNERKAQENWPKKWGFLQNPRKLWNKEAEKAGLPVDVDVFDQRNNIGHSQSCLETRKPKIVFSPPEGFPKLSSGMIGWRSFGKENNLNLLAGPMYTSRKLTMNPPPSPEEPDLRYQKIIFLG